MSKTSVASKSRVPEIDAPEFTIDAAAALLKALPSLSLSEALSALEIVVASILCLPGETVILLGNLPEIVISFPPSIFI